MVWLYGAFGSFAGIVFAFIVCGVIQEWARSNSSVADGLQSAYSGVSGVFLLETLLTFNIGLGSVTGCLLVHLFGRHRVTASLLMALFGGIASLLSIYDGFSFASGYGREAALSIFGVYFVWSLCLLSGGTFLIIQHINSDKSDLQ
ncbi:MAG TPA: hypothetical protein VF719_04155 [Abditibacteriaceae bacterium]|jgi:hypothetical protein